MPPLHDLPDELLERIFSLGTEPPSTYEIIMNMMGSRLEGGKGTDSTDISIYQYNVNIGNGAGNWDPNEAVWNSNALTSVLGPGFVFDKIRTAWSLRELNREVRIRVDLDSEHKRAPGLPWDPQVYLAVIRQNNSFRIDDLVAYLEGKVPFPDACLQSIGFLKNVIRQRPSGKALQARLDSIAACPRMRRLALDAHFLHNQLTTVLLKPAGANTSLVHGGIDVTDPINPIFGENVRYLNVRVCSLTSQHWAWKREGTCKVVASRVREIVKHAPKLRELTLCLDVGKDDHKMILKMCAEKLLAEVAKKKGIKLIFTAGIGEKGTAPAIDG